MVASLLALVVVAQGQTNLQRVIPQPTGRNGYEDYVYATDLTTKARFSSYERWWTMRMSGTFPDKDDAPPPGVKPDSTPLDIRKLARDRTGAVLDAVRAGNAKPVYEPRDAIGAEAIFPELAGFKQVAKAIVNRAHVEFAEGRSAAAVSDLIDVLTMSENLHIAVLIQTLVAIACESIALAEFQEHLSQLTLGDAKTIERYLARSMQRPCPFADVVRREGEFGKSAISDALRSGSFKDVAGDGANDPTGGALAKMSASERSEIARLVREQFDRLYAPMIAALSGPEPGWLKLKDPSTEPSKLRDTSVEGLAQYLTSVMTPVWTQFFQVAAKSRIQRGLLRAHARVIEYRWQMGKNPTKLEDLKDPNVTTDRFNGLPYVYEVDDGGYRLYSVAVPELGKIELKYRRQSQAPAVADPPSGDPR